MKWKWPTTVWASTCDVTEARPIHQVTHLRNRFQAAMSLHEPFQGCAVYTPGLCATVCVNTTHPPQQLLLPRHRAECLRWSRAHLKWLLGEWEAVLFSDESRYLVWIIQMGGLWCTAGWASASKMHAFDKDVRLAVVVWWCWVASQPMAGHPWSLLMAIWMHTATWRRLLDRMCCPSSVVREGTWPFSRTMLDHTLRVSSWIFSDMRMCWWWLDPRCPPICRQSSTCGTKWTDDWDNDQTSPSRCKDLAKPCKKFGKKSHKHSIPTDLVASMRRRCQECVNARGGHTHNWQCELLCDPHSVVTS